MAAGRVDLPRQQKVPPAMEKEGKVIQQSFLSFLLPLQLSVLGTNPFPTETFRPKERAGGRSGQELGKEHFAATSDR